MQNAQLKLTALADAILVAVAAQPMRAVAQDSLEEIIVTARRRAESLQDVPITISVFDEREIQPAGTERPRDFSASETGRVTARSAIRWGGGLLAAAVLALQAGQALAEPLTTAALEKWLAGYERAWESRDAAGAAELFTPTAAYHEMPFEAPKVGQAGIREYWSAVTADQRDIDFKSQVVAVNGQTGVAHWSATFTTASTGAHVELDGVFVLAFDASGRCSDLREWWHLRP